MAKAHAIHGLTAETPYAAAAARIVAVRTRELAEHSAAVLDVGDIERVHDMRVATRRLRAALEVFEPCFPRKRYRAALREVKALADALGERRDRDVTIAALEEVAAALGAGDRPGVESLISSIRIEQTEANEGLVPFVSEQRLEELNRLLMELVERAENEIAPESTEPVASELSASAAGNGGGAR